MSYPMSRTLYAKQAEMCDDPEDCLKPVIIHVKLLEHYKVDMDTIFIFQNKEILEVPPGTYYPCAFGVVVDCIRHGCRANKQSSWKIGK